MFFYFFNTANVWSVARVLSFALVGLSIFCFGAMIGGGEYEAYASHGGGEEELEASEHEILDADPEQEDANHISEDEKEFPEEDFNDTADQEDVDIEYAESLHVVVQVRNAGGGSWGSHASARPGEEVEFRIGIRNRGNATAQSVHVSFFMPDGIASVGNVRSAGGGGARITGNAVSIESLGAGEEAAFFLRGKVGPVASSASEMSARVFVGIAYNTRSSARGSAAVHVPVPTDSSASVKEEEEKKEEDEEDEVEEEGVREEEGEKGLRLDVRVWTRPLAAALVIDVFGAADESVSYYVDCDTASGNGWEIHEERVSPHFGTNCIYGIAGTFEGKVRVETEDGRVAEKAIALSADPSPPFGVGVMEANMISLLLWYTKVTFVGIPAWLFSFPLFALSVFWAILHREEGHIL